jgi:hypothetical protein
LGKRKADGECEGSADNKCVKQQAEAPEGSSALPVDPPAAEGEPAPVDGEATDAATPVDFVTELVDCPPGMVGRLIGKGGETIRTLEVRTRTGRRTQGMRLREKMVRRGAIDGPPQGTVGVDDTHGLASAAGAKRHTHPD